MELLIRTVRKDNPEYEELAERINQDYHNGDCTIVRKGAKVPKNVSGYVVIDSDEKVTIISKGGIFNADPA